MFTSHNDETGATLPCLPGFTANEMEKGMELTPRFSGTNVLLLFHTVQEVADAQAESRRIYMEAQA